MAGRECEKARGERVSFWQQLKRRLHPSSLESRFVVGILLFSTVFSVVITAGTLLWDYWVEVNNTGDELEMIGAVYVGPLSQGLWDFNISQVELIAEGISRVRSVSYVKVVDDLGNVVTRHGAQLPGPHVIEKSYRLVHKSRDLEFRIGSLVVQSDLRPLYIMLGEKLLFVLSLRFFTTIFISFFILWLFQRLVGRHLRSFAHQLRSPAWLRFEGEVRLVADKKRKGDYIDELQDSINAMHAELVRTHHSLRERDLRLGQVRRLEAIGRLAGGIAHDMNNALGGILGSAEILERKLANADVAVRRHITLIIDAIERTANRVRKLLAFARKAPTAMQTIDLRQVCDDAIALVESTLPEHLSIVRKYHLNSLSCRCDSSEIHAVILNLLINAREAMPSGGTITVELDRVEEKDAVFARVIIRDTGVGVAPEFRELIFEPFFTTKGVGNSGLGLSSAFGVIRALGGRIELESELNQGTSFLVYLPCWEMPAETDCSAANQRSALPPPRRMSLSVLLVDDDEGILEAVSENLRAWGYHVSACACGQDAVNAVREGQEFGVAVVDVVMPGMSGPDVIAQMEKLAPKMRFLAITGFSGQNDSMFAFLQERRIPILRKPFRMQELVDAMVSVME